jgi:hypothetical protein
MYNIDSTAIILLEAASEGMQQAIEDNSSGSDSIKDVDALLRALQIVVLRHDQEMNATLMLLELVGVSYVAFCARRPDEYQAILTSALANIELAKNHLIGTTNR